MYLNGNNWGMSQPNKLEEEREKKRGRRREGEEEGEKEIGRRRGGEGDREKKRGRRR